MNEIRTRALRFGLSNSALRDQTYFFHMRTNAVVNTL